MNDTVIAECQSCGAKWFHVHGPHSLKPCEACGGRLHCGSDCYTAEGEFIGKQIYFNGKLCTIAKYEGQP